MTLSRKEAAGALRAIAALLEVHGENPHRMRAFANAARVVERIEGDLGAMIRDGSILELRGIGRGTAAVLAEMAGGGTPAIQVELEERTPAGVRELLEVRGLGPKKVRILWRELGITGPGELEYACLENRLVDLPGFGIKSQERTLEAVRFVLRARDRHLVDLAWATAARVVDRLVSLPGVLAVEPAGEVRRGCATVGVVDLVVAAEAPPGVDLELGRTLAGAEKPAGGGWAWRSEEGVDCRIEIVPPDRFGAALLWATGARAHLDLLTERAQSGGLRLDASGLWSGSERVAGTSEKEIYDRLGCAWIPPELREGTDEIFRVQGGRLRLVELEDLRGTFHNHTSASDGAASVAEMAAAARELGWSFLGIADHSPAAHYANGLGCDRLSDQWAEIEAWNAAGTGPRVYRGLEADILSSGDLDVPRGCEDGLEYVVASVHSSFRLTEEAQTERILRAVRHPACTILGHPTGALRLARPGYAVNLERVLSACAEVGVVAEINANPYRLDLNWRWARRALELGVRLAINPDAHTTDGLGDVRWGLLVARKAGARPEDVVTTWSHDHLVESGILG